MIYRVRELEDREAQTLEWAKSTFLPGTLDNLPPDFLERCRPSDDPLHPECIVFTYADGMTPFQLQTTPGFTLTEYTTPTYKAIQPKKVSMVGKLGAMPKGTVVRPTCGYKYCINQAHLEARGVQRNQHSNSDNDE